MVYQFGGRSAQVIGAALAVHRALGQEKGRIDLVVANEIVVELKAVERLRDIHFAQLKSYLRATGLRVGLLFNFNAPTLTIRRMVLD